VQLGDLRLHAAQGLEVFEAFVKGPLAVFGVRNQQEPVRLAGGQHQQGGRQRGGDQFGSELHGSPLTAGLRVAAYL